MKDRELWMDKLKEKLSDYTEPIPDSGWEQLEKELAPSVEKRIYPYRRWAVAAAAVVLVVASSVSLYFLNSPVADEIRHISVPTLATAPDVLLQPQNPAAQIAKVEQAHTPHSVVNSRKMEHRLPVSEPLITPKDVNDPAGTEFEENAVASVEATEPDIVEKPDVAEQKAAEAVKAAEAAKAVKAVKAVRKPSGRDKLHLPGNTSSSRSGRWSIGASVGNTGGLLNNGNETVGEMPMMSEQRVDLAATENGMLQIPSDKTLVFKEGVPYLQAINEVVDIEHHQPVSFGISVRKGLAKGFSIETGIMYTLLSSDVKMLGSHTMADQKLHYLGIPLKANWNFLDKKLFSLYVSAGGAVEKCIYGKLGDRKETVNPLQFSVTGAVGAQFNASRRLGIYVEPGVAYFFNDGSPIQTIRKETPFNLNLQAGVRFTY